MPPSRESTAMVGCATSCDEGEHDGLPSMATALVRQRGDNGAGRDLAVRVDAVRAVRAPCSVGRRLGRHPPHLVPAAEVEDLHRRQLLDEVERHARRALPHGGVGTGADVRVDALHVQVVLRGEVLHLGQELEPDPEAGGRAAHVRLAGAPASEARVEAQPRGPAGEGLAEALHLRERAEVDLHALFHELGEEVGQFLRREGDALRGHARRKRAPDLVARAGVEVEAHGGEELQDGRVRGRLHCVPRRQTAMASISSSILRWSQTGMTVLAAIKPLPATAGTPMPGKVESPHCSSPGTPVLHVGHCCRPAGTPGP